MHGADLGCLHLTPVSGILLRNFQLGVPGNGSTQAEKVRSPGAALTAPGMADHRGVIDMSDRSRGRDSTDSWRRANLVKPLPETRIGQMIHPQSNGCWLYKSDGATYGHVSAYGSSDSVHRFVYRTLVGPIPRGHVIHHTCETPGCVNPNHLVALTRSEHGQEHARLRG